MQENETDPGDSILTLDSDIEGLERLRDFIDAFCTQKAVPEEVCYQLQVALEELVLNAMKYGECEPKTNAIRLTIRRDANEVHAVLSDTGIGFNPLEAQPPNLSENLSERPVGGLGIYLVRNFIPVIRYERCGNRNYLYMTKPINPEPGAVSPEGGTHADGNGDNQS